jgi:hypothetical protein
MNEGFGAWYADALIAAGVILPKYRIGEASVEEDGDGIRYWFRGVKQEGVNRDAVVKIEKYYEWLKGFSIEKEITTVTREIIPIE